MDIALVLPLIGVGIFAATYGSLVGSSDSFVVVPILLLCPESSPTLLTVISLTGILWRGYRDLGAILGVRIVHQISHSVFRIIMGIMLMMSGASLLRHPSHNVYTIR